MEKQLSEKLPRIEVVDALRGFAVMAILLVHNLEHFILKSASNLNDNLNCSKELEHYAS